MISLEKIEVCSVEFVTIERKNFLFAEFLLEIDFVCLNILIDKLEEISSD